MKENEIERQKNVSPPEVLPFRAATSMQRSGTFCIHTECFWPYRLISFGLWLQFSDLNCHICTGTWSEFQIPLLQWFEFRIWTLLQSVGITMRPAWKASRKYCLILHRIPFFVMKSRRHSFMISEFPKTAATSPNYNNEKIHVILWSTIEQKICLKI